MLSFLFGFGCGLVVAIIVGLLVWRNNRTKWAKVTDQALAYMDEYKDPAALKVALSGLLAKFKK